MDALLTVHLDGKQGHIFPEIEAEYRVAFAQGRSAYELQATKAAIQRQQEQTQASFIADTNDLNTVLDRQLAAFTPDNQAAGDQVLDAQIID
ncbi:MAG: hypothetical protein U5K75_00140 [Ahrensia sp.]|nr:hypothetical protein [Ahrensia sp.]